MLDALETRIAKSTAVDLRSLGIFRLIFGLFTMAFLWPNFSWIGTAPSSFFHPPILSLASFWGEFPSAGFFAVLDWVVIASTVTVTLGLLTRSSTVVLCLAVFVGYNFKYSFGKIDHGILYVALLAIMCFKDWGRFYSLDSLLASYRGKREPQQETTHLSLLAIFVAFGFATAAYGKAMRWIDFDLSTSGILSWLYDGYYHLQHRRFLAPAAVRLDAPLFWEIADYSAVVFEFACLPALLWRRCFFFWLLLAAGFHLANCLILQIPFIVNAIIYLAFVPWSRMPGIRQLCRMRPEILLGIVAALSSVAVCARLFDPRPVAYSLVSNDELLLKGLTWMACLVILAIAALISGKPLTDSTNVEASRPQ